MLGLDVADELGSILEYELFAAVDVTLDATGDYGIGGLDFALDKAAALDNELAFDVDAAVHCSGDTDITLAADIALDADGAADLGNFLFFCSHAMLLIEKLCLVIYKTFRVLGDSILCNCIV